MTNLLDLAKAKRFAKSGAARMIRVQAGLSLAEVAAHVGVSPTTIFRWERSERAPHGEAAVRWMRLLDELGRGV